MSCFPIKIMSITFWDFRKPCPPVPPLFLCLPRFVGLNRDALMALNSASPSPILTTFFQLFPSFLLGVFDDSLHRSLAKKTPVSFRQTGNRWRLPSGKHTKNYGKSPLLMGKSTISMDIFHRQLLVYQRVHLTEKPNSPVADPVAGHSEIVGIPSIGKTPAFYGPKNMWLHPHQPMVSFGGCDERGRGLNCGGDGGAKLEKHNDNI